MTSRASSVGGNAIFIMVTATSFVKTVATVVASLPSAATAGTGARAFVTDASVNTFGSAAVGGGTNKVPVYSDGSGWLIG
jgi:hypothetical protein